MPQTQGWSADSRGQVQRRLKSITEEFMSTNDVTDLRQSVAELPAKIYVRNALDCMFSLSRAIIHTGIYHTVLSLHHLQRYQGPLLAEQLVNEILDLSPAGLQVFVRQLITLLAETAAGPSLCAPLAAAAEGLEDLKVFTYV